MILKPSFLVALTLLSCVTLFSQTTRPDAQAIDAAVLSLRNAKKTKKWEGNDSTEKPKIVAAAWGVIEKSGRAGRQRIEEEIAALRKSGEVDDFFRISASGLLWWNYGKVERADEIAKLWNESTCLDIAYYYVFPMAADAAQTRDPRVLPMLRALLRDRTGDFFLRNHAVTIGYPHTHDLVWGAMGKAGLEDLTKLIRESKDANSLVSAIRILGDTGWNAALPEIRELARSDVPAVRQQAVKSLGLLGHPDDARFLLDGAMRADDPSLIDYLWALFEYRDLRAVEVALRHIGHAEQQVRGEALGIVAYLPTTSGAESLIHALEKKSPGTVRDELEHTLKDILGSIGLTAESYLALNPKDRETAMAAARVGMAFVYLPMHGEKPASRDESVARVDRWLKNGRIDFPDADEERIKAAHPGETTSMKVDGYAVAITRQSPFDIYFQETVGATSADDYDRWIELYAKISRRLSDEGLEEGNRVRTVLKWLGRRKIRSEPWVTSHAKPIEKSDKK